MGLWEGACATAIGCLCHSNSVCEVECEGVREESATRGMQAA